MPSVLADAPFTTVTLTYSAPTGEWTVDGNGNAIPAVTTGTLEALFAPYRFDQLRLLPGADAQVVAGRGELVDPMTFPEGVGVGSVLTLEWAGRDCELVITNVIPNDIPSVDFGTYFAGDIRPVEGS
jgi:hypothetical protein